LLGEGKALEGEGKVTRDRTRSWQDLIVKKEADGYRLPHLEEYEELVLKSGNYTLQGKEALRSAWMADNSGFTTHPVGEKGPDTYGLCDIVGNVSELCSSGDTHKSTRRNSLGYCPQFGGSFMDILDKKFPDHAEGPAAMGLAWPDIGFRVLRQSGAEKQAKVALPRPSEMAKRPAKEKFTWSGLSDLLFPSAFAEEAPGGFDPLQGRVHRGNLYRTGVHRTSGLKKRAGIQWEFKTDGAVRSSPVEVDGVVYVGSHDGNVYAIQADSGAQKWKFNAGGKISGSAAVANGIVYIASENGTLYALDAALGTKRWAASFRGTCAGSPAVVNGNVIIGSGARSGGGETLIMSALPMMAFDAETGKKVWKGHPGPQGYAAIATDGKNFYAGYGGTTYGIFDLENGRRKKEIKGGHQARQFMSMTVDGDHVYTPVSMRGSVICTDLNGSIVWHKATLDHNMDFEMNTGGIFGYEIFTDLAVTADKVYAGCNDGKLYTFDKEDGKKGWTFETGGSVQSSPSIADGAVYFGSWDGNLYALNAVTGKLLWKQPLGDRIISSPWPGDGVIYVGCDNGSIYAIH